jgi:hypothetical protein
MEKGHRDMAVLKRRGGIVALIGMVIGAAALIIGAGSASANSWPCSDQSPPQDTHVTVNNDTYVGVDLAPNLVAPGPGEYPHAWACVAPTGGEASQSWVNLWLSPTASGTGEVVTSSGCFSAALGCRSVLDATGASVATPSTTTSTSTSKPGGTVGSGSGTCVYVNGTTPAPGTTCPSGLTIAGVSIATGDANVSTRTVPGGCIGGAGNPCITTVPSGAAVTAGGGDGSNDTVATDVAGTPVKRDVAKTCVVNVFTDCTTP